MVALWTAAERRKALSQTNKIGQKEDETKEAFEKNYCYHNAVYAADDSAESGNCRTEKAEDCEWEKVLHAGTILLYLLWTGIQHLLEKNARYQQTTTTPDVSFV